MTWLIAIGAYFGAVTLILLWWVRLPHNSTWEVPNPSRRQPSAGKRSPGAYAPIRLPDMKQAPTATRASSSAVIGRTR